MSRIFIDKFHHCWLLKCSKSWTKSVRQRTPSYKRAKKEHIHCVIAFWFRYILLFCFMLALCCARRFWLAFEQWLQKILLTGAKIFMGPIESRTQKKQSMLYAGLIGACACATCIGWLSLFKSQCFCTFFSLFEQKPTIIRFNGENVRKWTLIHCSRRSMWLFCCCCCFRCYVHRAFMYMSCSHLVWWCRLPKLQFFSTSVFVPSAIPYNTRCPIERMHSFIVILLDCLLSIQSLSLHCKSLVLRFLLLFFASFRYIRLLFCNFCFAFCITFVVRARERRGKNKSA